MASIIQLNQIWCFSYFTHSSACGSCEIMAQRPGQHSSALDSILPRKKIRQQLGPSYQITTGDRAEIFQRWEHIHTLRPVNRCRCFNFGWTKGFILSLEFEPLMDTSFWSLPNDWTTTDPSLVYATRRSTECYDEQLSDKCMTLLLGTWYCDAYSVVVHICCCQLCNLMCWFLHCFFFWRKDNGTPCIVTKLCRDTMTRFGCPHYSLSHQLLYFMIGTMVWTCRHNTALAETHTTLPLFHLENEL